MLLGGPSLLKYIVEDLVMYSKVLTPLGQQASRVQTLCDSDYVSDSFYCFIRPQGR